jgi:hypothetical protein
LSELLVLLISPGLYMDVPINPREQQTYSDIATIFMHYHGLSISETKSGSIYQVYPLSYLRMVRSQRREAFALHL